jgi:hypothetical protein
MAWFTVDGSGHCTLEQLAASNETFDAIEVAMLRDLPIGASRSFDIGAGLVEVRRISEVTAELADEIIRLTDCAPRIEHNREIGLFGVFLSIADGEGGEDIIGSGETDCEALAAALRTIRAWE